MDEINSSKENPSPDAPKVGFYESVCLQYLPKQNKLVFKPEGGHMYLHDLRTTYQLTCPTSS